MIKCDIDFSSLPSYPKVMRDIGYGTAQNEVFMIMPFEAPHSDDLWKIVQSVSEDRGLHPARGDSSNHSRLIINEVLYHLETAEIVIADLTNCSPNVLYELGIAHTRLDCESVILLCHEETKKKIPFNVSHCSYITFHDLEKDAGRKKLQEDLHVILDKLQNKTAPTIITSSLERTQQIATDLRQLLKYQLKGPTQQTIWFSGGLSAFSISDQEPYDPQEQEYKEALLQERDLLLDLARAGCPIKCIITTAPVPRAKKEHYIKYRIKYLLNFLESKKPEDLKALKNIEWAISPFRQINLYIIGNISFFEGYKEGEGRGFGLTLRQTGLEAIHAKVSLQEVLFNALKKYTSENYGAHADSRVSVIQYLHKNYRKELIPFKVGR
ncbi:MAG TPA: hypothetical protein VHY08_21670 [Bacillota bacterium]|nr:hypothetical protein [Bacillota bacterium]